MTPKIPKLWEPLFTAKFECSAQTCKQKEIAVMHTLTEGPELFLKVYNFQKKKKNPPKHSVISNKVTSIASSYLVKI